QTEKAANLGREGPDRGEQVVVSVMQSPLLGGTDGPFPWFGSVYEGTGFGVGGGYLRRMPRASRLSLIAGIAVNGSTLLRGDYVAPRLLDRIEPHASVSWARAKDVPFFGVGNESVRAGRTSFDFDPAIFAAGINYRALDWLWFTADYQSLG